MAKIIFNNKNYNIDESALAPAMAALEAHLRSMAGGADPVMLKAGLYETGAIALAEEQGAEAIEGMMIKSWDDLLAEGVVHVDDGIVYTNADMDEWVNTSSDALSGDLILPNDGSITALGEFRYNGWYDSEGRAAFALCYNLTGIMIPEAITEISDVAFYECEGLENVVISEGVSRIGNSAFEWCAKLTDIIIPNSVTTMGNEVFRTCDTLTNVVLPDSLTSISYNMFYQCTALASITIPNSVTTINYGPFFGCTSLTSVIIPNNVTSIAGSAFRQCTNLNTITFNGTMAQWGAVSKESSWNTDVPATYVQCSDGQVAI